MAQELIEKNEQTAVVVKNESQQLMDLISALASNPQADVSKFNALLDLKERIEDKEAEKRFNEDYLKMSKELPRIKKDGSVEYKDKKTDKLEKAFNFATWENIDRAIRPILEKYGFALSFDTQPRADGGGAVVKGILLHVSGHKREASITLALDSSGGKNNIQGMGSTFSYGKRYTATMLLNLVTEGEDDDGIKAGLEFLDLDKQKTINGLLDETKSNVTAFLEYFKVKEVQFLTEKQYPVALKKLEQKKTGAKK